MNALRFGGSQTFAASLAERLCDAGFEVAIVAKRGENSATFEKECRVQHVLWAEGSGGDGGVRQAAARWAGYASLARLTKQLRRNPPVAWVASQPWPIHYAAVSRRLIWPDAARIGLVHGTTAVEIPPPGGVRELVAMDRVYTTTPEAATALRERYRVEALNLGNIFDADSYWERPRLPTPLGHRLERVLFLGTLTGNKVAPLRALLELAAGMPRLRVTVTGAGPERLSLEALAGRTIPGRSRFTGGLTDPREEIEGADLVVAAGRAAIEAASRPRRVVVANGDGVLGALRPDRIGLCRDHNFTGRAPGSGPATPTEMARALHEAEALDTAALAANASELSRVGDARPLLDFVTERARARNSVPERDL